MSATAVTRTSHARSWPLTPEALRRLDLEITRTRDELSVLTSRGLEEGIVRLPVAVAAKRLDTLRQVLAGAEVIEDPGCVVIGRRVTLRDSAGELLSCSIVFPGDGDPASDCISADSPLGAAILRARAGDEVQVDAPAGHWSITVVTVE